MEDMIKKLAETIQQKDELIHTLESRNHDYMVCLMQSVDQCMELEVKNTKLVKENRKLTEDLKRIKEIEERNQERIQRWLEMAPMSKEVLNKIIDNFNNQMREDRIKDLDLK